MFPIVEARSLAPDVKLFRIQARRIARKHQAGQFVIVRVHEQGERIPLTIAASDPQAGEITIIVQGVGKTVTIDELLREEGYDAVFIATGAGLPKFLNVPGEHLGGVYSANEFLTRVNLMKAYDPEHFDSPIYTCRDRDVAVVGGGNTAMDAVRSALRLGARSASIVYRRSEAEMPARREEVHHARDEGVQFLTLHNPVEFIGNEQGYLEAMKLVRMELGEPDASGRRQPRPVAGSEFVMPIDVAIIAVGTGANPLVQSSTPDLQTNRWGYILADEQTMRTTKRGVFAGGDVVSGSATVILAMGAGRTAARAIHAFLASGEWPDTPAVLTT